MPGQGEHFEFPGDSTTQSTPIHLTNHTLVSFQLPATFAGVAWKLEGREDESSAFGTLHMAGSTSGEYESTHPGAPRDSVICSPPITGLYEVRMTTTTAQPASTWLCRIINGVCA